MNKFLIFTQNWLDHMLLNYGVIARNHRTKLVSKCARGMNEQLLETWGTDVLSSREKLIKTMGGGGYVRRLKSECQWLASCCLQFANWRRYTFYFTNRGNKGRVEINRDVCFTDTVLWFQIWFFCNYCFLLWLMWLLFWATRYLRNSWYRSMLLNSQFFQRFDLPM